MKQILKNTVASILGWQVRRLRKKTSFITIGVVGSIGKTNTKLAIAEVLEKKFKVQYQSGNYNDIVSVPLIYFGHSLPSLFSPVAWLKIFISNEKILGKAYPYDIVVLELGTDGPGQINAFSKYVSLDYAVITAITPEHMEYFETMEAVVQEELSIKNFAKKLIYNTDYIDAAYYNQIAEGSVSYAIKNVDADFHLANIYHSAQGLEADVKYEKEILLHFAHEVVSSIQLYSVLAAIIVARELEMKTTEIIASIANIRPVSGRLRRLRGINNSTIIDDTYNSSPAAVEAGLEMLYKLQASQKIAILGSMNELGSMSADAHTEIGKLCDPKHLDLLVTIGAEANKYTASAAEASGCTVKKFDDPYAAGEYLQSQIKGEAIIFAKGSQNGVFAEEVIKLLLADPEDANKLVRQSPYWMQRKKKGFNKG
ncbi:hypothetical protein H0V99_02355 [Candidatus Saccharibacteria bacterium]|nr:hypothetical protein [Candidatus Saccharibacteria bacterium]